MSLTCNLIISAYSLAILVIIFLHSLRNTERNLLQHKLFLLMAEVTALLLIVDAFSRFDGSPGTVIAAVNHAANFMIFLASPLLPSLWLLYVRCHIASREDTIKRRLRYLAALFGLNAVMLLLSQFFGLYYTIGPDNVYRRGPFFWAPVAVTVILVASAYTLMLRRRKSIDKKHFLSLLLFPLPPLAGVILQVAYYGTSLILNGAAISILIAFVTLQNERLNTDYLTGAYNRKGLEKYIRQKINACTESRTFSGILLDLDNFKAINDTFGHNTGDEVLTATVALLKDCLQPDGFIARFGGDEFIVILGISDEAELEKTAEALRGRFIEQFTDRIEPLTPDISMGFAVYDPRTHPSAEEFQRQLDASMYRNKRAGKASGPLPGRAC